MAPTIAQRLGGHLAARRPWGRGRVRCVPTLRCCTGPWAWRPYRGETVDLLFILRWSRDSAPDYGGAWLPRCRRTTRCSRRLSTGTGAAMAPLSPPCVRPASSAAPPVRPAGRIRTTLSSSKPQTRRSPPDTGPVSAVGRSRPTGPRRHGWARCWPTRPSTTATDRSAGSTGAAGDAMLLAVAPVETPLGVMLLGAAEGKLCLAEYSDQGRLEAQLRRVRQRLAATGAGHRAGSASSRFRHEKDATLVPGREAPIADAEAELDWDSSNHGVLRRPPAALRSTTEVLPGTIEPLLPAGTDLQRQVWETLLPRSSPLSVRRDL